VYDYNLGIRFQRVAHEHAAQTALWLSSQESIKYGDLNKLANRIARMLLAKGLRPGDVVCLSGTKTILTFGFILACLKVGVVYALLDPDTPTERLRKMLRTCDPRLVVGGGDFLDKIAQETREFIDNDPALIAKQIGGYSSNDLKESESITGSNPAYIMFTSGSTGFPKGAVMTHANVLNLINWSEQAYSLNSDDVLTNVNPLFFDNSVFDFYAALFTGARLVPFSKDEVQDPKALVDKVKAAGCTSWFSVPSLLMFLQTMKATDGKNLRSIRRFIFGGEAYPKARLKKLYDTYSDSSEFFNVYGPTECTCICSSYKVTEEDFRDLQGPPPLGYIAENFSYLIVGENGNVLPEGETGELCLLGPNVGRGYYNDPERTALSFVQNPRNSSYPDVMYKTGDLVRLDSADGKLYIEGRLDNQIKHMGYRIELEEIEAALHCLEYISEAVALHTHSNGLSRLIAIVASRGQIEDEQIRTDLSRIIPGYMIPSAFHREQTLPCNSSGKIDRTALARKYAPTK
jgi:D-alanine--poly(phosphoribitol) ligase subunit 1